MKKEILVSVLICFFVFPSSIKAKNNVVEQIYFFQNSFSNPYQYLWVVENPGEKTYFKKGTFLSVNIPPSKKYETLFFHFWLNARLNEDSAINHLIAEITIWGKAVSDSIPEGIEVLLGIGNCGIDTPKQGLHPRLYQIPQKRNIKTRLQRDDVGFWWVIDSASGKRIPDDEAITVLNALLANGFDIEFYFDGYIQGINKIRLGPTTIEITRVSNK